MTLERPQVYGRRITSLWNRESVVYSEISIDWKRISARRKHLGKTKNEPKTCELVSMLVRQHLEDDQGVPPDIIQFKSVTDKKGEFWHVWTEVNGGVIDPREYRNMYSFLYPIGEPDLEHEETYKALMTSGWREELRNIKTP